MLNGIFLDFERMYSYMYTQHLPAADLAADVSNPGGDSPTHHHSINNVIISFPLLRAKPERTMSHNIHSIFPRSGQPLAADSALPKPFRILPMHIPTFTFN